MPTLSRKDKDEMFATEAHILTTSMIPHLMALRSSLAEFDRLNGLSVDRRQNFEKQIGQPQKDEEMSRCNCGYQEFEHTEACSVHDPYVVEPTNLEVLYSQYDQMAAFADHVSDCAMRVSSICAQLRTETKDAR